MNKLEPNDIDQCIKFRRWIHQHPELSYQEFKTYEYIYSQLETISGLEFDCSLKPSLLVTLNLNPHGTTIAFRCDIDALPLQEQTTLDFKSQVNGCMHACMHDMHSASILSLIHVVARQRSQFKQLKAIKFIFQSAEENPEFGGGAIKIAQSGFLQDADYLFANHFDSSQPLGTITSSTSAMTANTDVFTINLHGVGAHASRPQQAKDVVVAGAELILSLQTIIAREIDPFHPAVLSLCDIHAGEGAFNVLPDKLTIRGTLRTMTQDTRDICHAAITRKVAAIAQAYDLDATYQPVLGYPSVISHATCLNLLKDAIPEGFQFKDGILGMGGEDVSYLINAVPNRQGILFLTGVADPQKPGSCFPLHNPQLEGNEDALQPLLTIFLNLLEKINA